MPDLIRPKSRTFTLPRWGNLSLSVQFLAVGGLVLTLSMAILGTLVGDLIRQTALRTAGEEWAAFLGAFLEPHIQQMAPEGPLTAQEVGELDALFVDTPLGERLVSIKIWSLNGKLLYSTLKENVGEVFDVDDVPAAASGKTVVALDDADTPESEHENDLGVPLIEVYAPLHDLRTGEVIAVGELYEEADLLVSELANSRTTTFMTVSLTTALMLGALYFIVHHGTLTIARQRADLRQHVEDAQQLASLNRELMLSADRARLDASEANEHLLARIGSDLHDGPVQLLSLVMLRLSAGTSSVPPEGLSASQVDELITITQTCLAELRNNSAGLSLPEIGDIGIRETLELAVFRHEDLTGSKVFATFSDLPETVSDAVKTCAYRVVQEGLTNAFKHAPGAEVTVSARGIATDLIIEVADTGGTAPSDEAPKAGHKLGLAGMRNRVGALKGTLEITALRPRGRKIRVTLPIST
ncbi:histidine kinase [Devosia sp. ZB163]|uniref:sensor histidine kinase n=1 Tax=Devosia sp. ZB163 TaxID=3025938 RepID=UPI00235EE0B5|nr:ATP-binding protein [Devosia sp. ZB163]MDC9825126.1 histidine kinase [Devosia sp. ZB163]